MSVRTPRDLCKGCRECYSTILIATTKSGIISGICMGIPTYLFLFVLMFKDNVWGYSSGSMYYLIQSEATGPFFTLLGFTIFLWLLGLASIRFTLPNVLTISGFIHNAIGSWWLVNFCILFFGGWSYIPSKIMIPVLIGILLPGLLWLLTADIIRQYKRKQLADISLLQQPQPPVQTETNIFEGNDIELGEPK